MWQVIREGSRKVVPNIEGTIPSLVPKVKVQGAVVKTMGPRVGSQSCQSTAQPPPELKLQRVVVRCQSIIRELNDRELWIRGRPNEIFPQQPSSV